MKRCILLICTALLSHGSAQADNDAPIRYRGNGMTVVMHSSMTPITLVRGDNPLGKPRKFTCGSAAGCVVVTSVSAQYKDTSGTSTCTYVDGEPGAPGCAIDPEDRADNVIGVRQQFKVSHGMHIVETKTYSYNTVGEIVGWAVDYVIYEREVGE